MSKYIKGIITVWGRHACGKTSTLIEVCDLLKQAPQSKVIHQSAILPAGDRTLIVQVKKIVIAVETKGDPNTDLELRLKNIVQKWKPNLIFCSSRTKGDTVHAVNRVGSSFGYERFWSTPYDVARDLKKVNKLKAKQLIEAAKLMNFMQ